MSNVSPTVAKNLPEFERVLAKLERDSEAAIKQLNALSEVGRKEIMEEVVRAITPVIRQQLALSYRRSGVGRDTGTLEKVVVTQAIIGATADGYYIKYAPNVRYPDGNGNPYGAAGGFKYGAVRQPLTKAKGSLYKDLPTGEMRARKYAAGDFGDKAKRTLKKALVASRKRSASGANVFYGSAQVAEGVHVTHPKPGFFEFDQGQQAAIMRAAIPVMVAAFRKRGIMAVGG